jgi:hypothetical protein
MVATTMMTAMIMISVLPVLLSAFRAFPQLLHTVDSSGFMAPHFSQNGIY